MRRPLFIINDCHLGVSRTGGTTKASAADLAQWQMEQFHELLSRADGHDLLINGDLFDRFEVSKQVEFATFVQLVNWLNRNPAGTLLLSAGNHDLSTNSERRSSFENLAYYLEKTHAAQVNLIMGEPLVFQGAAIIPHLPNQQLFDECLESLVTDERPFLYVFIHANLMSPFAAHSDHSLNVSEAILDKFAGQGITLVFAHEHNARVVRNATVIGNQIPSSVSDCLDDNGCKQYATVDEEGLHTHEFLSLADVYADVDWQSEGIPDKAFIRVSGQATYEQASEVVQRIADIRRDSRAFVVSNAVKVAGITATQDVGQELSELDVQQMVLSELPEELATRFKEVVNHE